VIKLYGEETGGAVSIIEQPLGPGLLSPPPGPGLGIDSNLDHLRAHARGGFHG
jgi:L-alanine-DL-glutamate epimerase-like enolase superfamily enzyme